MGMSSTPKYGMGTKKVMQDGGPVNPKPNAVKYKVPLTTKKASERLIHLSKKSQRGTRNPISLQLEQECHSLVNK
jgi:hypothetical protein